MSNTLKFGAGNWATKEGSTLAYNDLNSNFKPLPFNFSRDSKATVINKDGLIETVGNGQPRIDYKDDSKGALLLEPSRTNKALYSEDFSQSFWTKSNASVVSGFSSPDGNNNAYKLVEDASNSNHFIRTGFIGTTDGGSINPSIFVKSAERSQVVLQEDAYTGQFMTVDLIAETISTNGQNANLTKLADGWFRIDFISIGRPSTRWKVSPAINLSSTYQGDGTSGIYIFGFQLEDNVSYPTSYIPTQGSAVTRLKDACSQTPPTSVIGQTEGVLYFEGSALADDGTSRDISLSDGTSSNYVRISLSNAVGFIEYNVVVGTTQASGISSITQTDNNKIAVKYKENDFALWVNGVEVDVDGSGVTFSASVLDILSFDRGSGINPFYGKVKDVRVYNTALTDSELASLTQV